MAQTLTKLATFFRPFGNGDDDIVTFWIEHDFVNLAEEQLKANNIRLENLINLPEMPFVRRLHPLPPVDSFL